MPAVVDLVAHRLNRFPLMSSFSLLRLTLPALALLISSPWVAAQTARPGSSARTTAGSTSRATQGSSSSSGGGRSAAGTHQYRSNTELGDATIQIDPETRSLVIVTDEDTHRELIKVIQTLDKPKPQVLIKVVFLEVTYNNDYDVGVEGSYTFNLKNGKLAATGARATTSTQNSTNNGVTTATTTTTNTPLDTAAGIGTTLGLASSLGQAALTDGSFLRLASDDWSATLHALSEKGKLEVLSRPSIMARNNQEAVIVVGSEVPFVTNSRITDDGQTINTIQYDNVGIILRVTPFITSEGTVEMIVAPEISTLTDQTVPISNTVSAPVIAKRSAETVVVTPNAQTVVIGGLMETQHTETIRKIPLLGDIPYLGFPFRRTIKSDVKKELLIFLTPYIVNDAKGLRNVTTDEVDRTDLIEQAYDQKDFDKYLDSLPMPGTEPSLMPQPEIRRATAVKPTNQANFSPNKQQTKPTKAAPKNSGR
jgi:general secretion pathway protein D